MDAKLIAEQTLAAFNAGYYTAPDGSRVNIAAPLAACVQVTREYGPDALSLIRDAALAHPASAQDTQRALTAETTLQAAAQLTASGAYQRVGVLNFASARKPGGGFLRGAISQEESLARSSGLYFSLATCPEFYAHHHANESLLYSDRMIYSPACPVIRDDAGGWLPTPYLVDFITSAAPNAGAIAINQPESLALITPTLAERAAKALALAWRQGCDALVLGAWGCGVVRNDPATVARIFHDALGEGGPFAHHFRLVHFAVTHGRSESPNYAAFARYFGDA